MLAGALAGLALATGLILHFGWRQVSDEALAAGWWGVAALIAIYFVCLVLCALAWRVVVLDAPRNATIACLWGRWLRESVGNLLPLVPTAGELAGARELTFHGVRPGIAGASTIVDLTLELVSQMAFTATGLTLFFLRYQGREIGGWIIGGLTLSVAATAGFILAQQLGLFRLLERLTESLDLKWAWNSLPGREGVHGSIQKIYRHRRRVSAGTALHLAGWFIGAAEAWVALWFMGHPLPLLDALTLESLAFALRTAAFAVPSRLGVQEGGYVLLGTLFGLSPEVALALSLLKRAREIITGVPCLTIWQGVEVRRLWWGLPSKSQR